MTPDVEAALRIAAAALGGAAVGVERQWSGHASGPRARFGGVRTFTLLGGVAGLAGWLWSGGGELLAALLVGGAAAVVVAGYVAASRGDVDATTEVAALVVLGAGVVAGQGRLALASGMVALTALLLVEKSRLHAGIARLADVEVRAAARFAVMAVVILPLLPEGPIGPLGGIQPRLLWALVLLFSGLSFAGWIARRAVGPRHGAPVAGLLGGIVSSTSVTAAFARASRDDPAQALALAAGALGASAIMYVRVLLTTALLHAPLALRLTPLLVPPGALAAALFVLRWRGSPSGRGAPEGPRNPLDISSAVQMAVLFQLVLFGIHAVRTAFGDLGLVPSGALLGVTDVDALVLAMTRSAASGARLGPAAQAIALGVLANGALKLGVALSVGGPAFRRRAGLDLAGPLVAGAVVLAIVAARQAR